MRLASLVAALGRPREEETVRFTYEQRGRLEALDRFGLVDRAVVDADFVGEEEMEIKGLLSLPPSCLIGGNGTNSDSKPLAPAASRLADIKEGDEATVEVAWSVLDLAVAPFCACGAKCAKKRPDEEDEFMSVPDPGYWSSPLPGEGPLAGRSQRMKKLPMSELPRDAKRGPRPDVVCSKGCVGRGKAVEWRCSGSLADGVGGGRAVAKGRDAVTRLLRIGKEQANEMERACWDAPVGVAKVGGVKKDWLKRFKDARGEAGLDLQDRAYLHAFRAVRGAALAPWQGLRTLEVRAGEKRVVEVELFFSSGEVESYGKFGEERRKVGEREEGTYEVTRVLH